MDGHPRLPTYLSDGIKGLKYSSGMGLIIRTLMLMGYSSFFPIRKLIAVAGTRAKSMLSSSACM